MNFTVRQAVAYLRVSTKGQGASGFGIAAQRAQIERYAELRGYRIKQVFIEVASAMSDLSEDRPILAAALKKAKKRKQVVLVASMDRLTRDRDHFAKLQAAKDPEIEIADLNPNASTITLQAAAARAQREGELIGERTRKALAEAKAMGTLLGNRTNLPEAQAKGTAENARVAAIRMEELRAEIIAVQNAGATTAAAIAAALNKKKVRTAQGGAWTTGNVRRVLRTLGTPKSFKDLAHVGMKPFFTLKGRLTDEGRERLSDVLKEQRGGISELMRSLGCSPSDASLSNALKHDHAILDPELIDRVTKWIIVSEWEKDAQIDV